MNIRIFHFHVWHWAFDWDLQAKFSFGSNEVNVFRLIIVIAPQAHLETVLLNVDSIKIGRLKILLVAQFCSYQLEKM